VSSFSSYSLLYLPSANILSTLSLPLSWLCFWSSQLLIFYFSLHWHLSSGPECQEARDSGEGESEGLRSRRFSRARYNGCRDSRRESCPSCAFLSFCYFEALDNLDGVHPPAVKADLSSMQWFKVDFPQTPSQTHSETTFCQLLGIPPSS
jgi:hypothetical protein